jgi:riboflavin kinase/FMN adenylyltransferase
MPPRHAGEPILKPVLLTTLPEKLQILKRFGINEVQVLVFDRKTASTSPEEFFSQTLVRKHHAQEMVVGPRVAFGKNRAGRLPLVRLLGKRYGVRIQVVPNISGKAGVVSSRRIRALLADGHVEKANAFLGYPYSVEGRVVHGVQRGRRLGFPTANIDVTPGKILPRGVFWVKVYAGNRIPLNVPEALKGVDGLCNVGVRPTFTPHSHALHCEVFLLRGGQNLYGKKLRVVFLRRIRAERRFSSPEALKRQIAKDLAKAQLYRKAHFSI